MRKLWWIPTVILFLIAWGLYIVFRFIEGVAWVVEEVGRTFARMGSWCEDRA